MRDATEASPGSADPSCDAGLGSARVLREKISIFLIIFDDCQLLSLPAKEEWKHDKGVYEDLDAVVNNEGHLNYLHFTGYVS